MTRRREDIPDAGATMQIDAIADELLDLGPTQGDAPGPPLPPPLPPKKVGKAVWIVGALVVLAMIALGIGAGYALFGGEPAPPPAAAARPTPSAPSPPDVPTPTPGAPAAEEPPPVLQLEEVVVEAPAEP
ncbi:MAG TPA: hypothetical protein VIL20_10925 [Sandaracinaceae bacterium]